MTIALVAAGGVAYAACLWFVAASIARRRGLALGPMPYWAIISCGIAAAGVDSLMAPRVALLAAPSLIGAIVCAVVDARTGFIFDALSLTMLLVGCVVAIGEGHFFDSALAAAAVGAGLGALYLLTGRRGIGLGDVKLGSIIAFGYGLGSGFVAIGSAFVLGAAYAVVMLGLGRAKRSDAMRFGPFIAGGAAVGLGAGVLGWPW